TLNIPASITLAKSRRNPHHDHTYSRHTELDLPADWWISWHKQCRGSVPFSRLLCARPRCRHHRYHVHCIHYRRLDAAGRILADGSKTAVDPGCADLHH